MNRKVEQAFIDFETRKKLNLSQTVYGIIKILANYDFTWGIIPTNSELTKYTGKLCGICKVKEKSKIIENNIIFIKDKIKKDFSVETLHDFVINNSFKKVQYWIIFNITK